MFAPVFEPWFDQEPLTVPSLTKPKTRRHGHEQFVKEMAEQYKEMLRQHLGDETLEKKPAQAKDFIADAKPEDFLSDPKPGGNGKS